MMKRHRYKFYVLLWVLVPVSGQRYLPADPFNLLQIEKAQFLSGGLSAPLTIRPVFMPLTDSSGNWSVKIRNEFFSNSNAPNLENTSDRRIGKGHSFFSSVNLAYTGRFLALSVEPYYFTSENRAYSAPIRPLRFSNLNDAVPYSLEPTRWDNAYTLVMDSTGLKSPDTRSGLRETQIYVHLRGFGLGFSNANMWWGPGLHSSLNMTNNAPGFKHLLVGTLQEQRLGNFGFQARYIFADSSWMEKNKASPYFSAVVFSGTLYSDPILTFGFSRSILSGGSGMEKELSRKKAMGLPFKPFYLEERVGEMEEAERPLDIWDQTFSWFISAAFPESGLKVYLEYGRNNPPWNKKDFWRQPDHTGASVLGIRKYGLFGKEQLIGGVEYTNLIRDRFWHLRESNDWYEEPTYDNWSYDGRRWGAHSGSDSDDFTIYLGWLGDTFSIIPAFNYERHGIIRNEALLWRVKLERISYDPEAGRWVPVFIDVLTPEIEDKWNIWPEVKFEFRLDLRIALGGYQINVYFEDEFVDNLEFRESDEALSERRGSVLWLGIERQMDLSP